MSCSEPQSPLGVVELREDIPLTSRAKDTRLCASGPRAIVGAFAALTAAVTVALLAQIYYGDYEVEPHGSVSSSAAACSRAGVAALRAGGRAVDAATATALCLAVLAPHRTSLDSSGSLVYWEYRSSRIEGPTSVEWGGPETVTNVTDRPPRLLVALAALHSRLGTRPWKELLQSAIDLAREGYLVSENLSAIASIHGIPGFTTAALRTEPSLAEYLERVSHNTSTELCSRWPCSMIRWRPCSTLTAGTWRVWWAGAKSGAAALQDALFPTPRDTEEALQRVLGSLQQQRQNLTTANQTSPSGVSSGLAVIDPLDTYVALVTGLSVPFGSEALVRGTWYRDEPTAPLDLAPAIITDEHVCGTRYVMGAESSAALAQGAAGALVSGAALAVDAVESSRAALPPPEDALPQPALNFVQQRGDALLSHADSRGGGLASRF